MPIDRFDHNDHPTAAAEKHTPNNWFEAAYEDVASKSKSVAHKTATIVKEHPGEAAVVAGVAVVGAYALLRGKSDFRIVKNEAEVGEKLVGNIIKESAEANTAKAAKVAFEAPALERKTVEGTVIPDVARPTLEKLDKGLSLTSPDALAATTKKYESGLSELFKLPRETVAEAGHDLDQVAVKTLQSRAATTGERVTEAASKAEAERLAALNPGLKSGTDLGGTKITVLDHDHLAKLAGSDLQFKFTPQLGQFLKAGGKITEEHISEAFAVQKGGSKKLLGEILVDLNHATKADVEQAFTDQNTVKAALKAAREAFLQKF